MSNPPNKTSTAVELSRADDRARARLREARDRLRAAGIDNADECLRLGAAAMTERCLAEYETRGNVGLGWLAQAIREGGAWFNRPAPPRRETASDMLRIINGGAA